MSLLASTVSRVSSIAGILGRNLIIARCAAGFTQQELAERALISRATVVQIESGTADPKISTLQQIAGALGVASSLLLVGIDDLKGLASLIGQNQEALSPQLRAQAQKLNELLSTGRVRELMEAARLASRDARQNGADLQSAISAAIGAVLLPSTGGLVGAAWRASYEPQKIAG